MSRGRGPQEGPPLPETVHVDYAPAYAPWMLDVYRIENVVVYPWVQGYKYNPIDQHPWQYYDLDPARKRIAVQ